MKIELFKLSFILSVLLFADWVLLVLIGSFSAMFRAPEKFYCTVYCYFGLSLLAITLLSLGYIMLRTGFRNKIQG